LQNFSNTLGSNGRKLEGFFLVLDNVEICLIRAELRKADSSSSIVDTRTLRSGNLEAGIVRSGSAEVDSSTTIETKISSNGNFLEAACFSGELS
jgi:hypothetical protein